jgi:hypothetical protein
VCVCGRLTGSHWHTEAQPEAASELETQLAAIGGPATPASRTTATVPVPVTIGPGPSESPLPLALAVAVAVAQSEPGPAAAVQWQRRRAIGTASATGTAVTRSYLINTLAVCVPVALAVPVTPSRTLTSLAWRSARASGSLTRSLPLGLAQYHCSLCGAASGVF